MAAGRPQRPLATASVAPPEGSTPDVLERAVQDLAANLGSVETVQILRARAITADLAVGTNKINHGLGRAPVFVAVTPTTCDASWAWAWRVDITTNPRSQVWIETVGVAQENARILVY